MNDEFELEEDPRSSGPARIVRNRRIKKPWNPATMRHGEIVEAILLNAYGRHWRLFAPSRLGVKAPYLAKVIAGEIRVGEKLKVALAEFCQAQVAEILDGAKNRAIRMTEMQLLIKDGGLDDPSK